MSAPTPVDELPQTTYLVVSLHCIPSHLPCLIRVLGGVRACHRHSVTPCMTADRPCASLTGRRHLFACANNENVLVSFYMHVLIAPLQARTLIAAVAGGAGAGDCDKVLHCFSAVKPEKWRKVAKDLLEGGGRSTATMRTAPPAHRASGTLPLCAASRCTPRKLCATRKVAYCMRCDFYASVASSLLRQPN